MARGAHIEEERIAVAGVVHSRRSEHDVKRPAEPVFEAPRRVISDQELIGAR